MKAKIKRSYKKTSIDRLCIIKGCIIFTDLHSHHSKKGAVRKKKAASLQELFLLKLLVLPAQSLHPAMLIRSLPQHNFRHRFLNLMKLVSNRKCQLFRSIFSTRRVIRKSSTYDKLKTLNNTDM